MIDSVAIGDVLANPSGHEWVCDALDEGAVFLLPSCGCEFQKSIWLTFDELNDPDRPWQNLGRPD